MPKMKAAHMFHKGGVLEMKVIPIYIFHLQNIYHTYL